MIVFLPDAAAKLFKWFSNNQIRSGARTAATSKIECFAIIVNGWKLLTIITKHSILDVAAVLDPSLQMNQNTCKYHLFMSKYKSSKIHIVGSIIEAVISQNYYLLTLTQNFVLMIMFKICAKKLTENCEH